MSNFKKAVLVVCSEEEMDTALKQGRTILTRKEYPKQIEKPFEIYLYCKLPYQRVFAKGEYAGNTIHENGGKNYYDWTITNIKPLKELMTLRNFFIDNGEGGYILLKKTTRRQYIYTKEENPR